MALFPCGSANGGGGGAVTGVKGSAEISYRTGNVDISAANIGLGNVDNTSDLDKPISTATQTALNGKVDTVAGKGLSTNDYDDTAKGIVDGVTTALAGKVSTTSVGSANGVAELDANGKVPSSQLPSYVDDTTEGYLNSVDGKFYADSSYTTEITGETGKIYVTVDTNKTYRWSGSAFVEISESLALGETSSTAYAGNKGKANADAITAIKDGTTLDSFSDVENEFSYLTFEGTQAEWNLLSTTEKKKYKQAIFTDDYSDNPVGNLNALNTTSKTSCVSAINEVNENLPKGLVEKLSLFSAYGYTESPINIDTINNEFGYIMCIMNGAGFSGTFPSGLDGNRALLMGLSQINPNNNLVRYGVQIAISFGSSKIAIRNTGFSESGSAWGSWKYIEPAN